jgi:hypothetical protein
MNQFMSEHEMPDGTTSTTTASETVVETAEQAASGVGDDLRPGDLAPEFWDDGAKAVRLDALIEAHRALKTRLAQAIELPQGPEDRAALDRLRAALGRPENPDGYTIEPRHALIAPDPELNGKLHEAGFSQDQAQLVYDLAADFVLPMLGHVVAEVEAERHTERLVQSFGGRETWSRTAGQLRAWGQANLDEQTYATLAASSDGVLAMHELMKSREPALVTNGDAEKAALDEQTLHEMVGDPRYWRDRDPEFIARVTEGFERLYRR